MASTCTALLLPALYALTLLALYRVVQFTYSLLTNPIRKLPGPPIQGLFRSHLNAVLKFVPGLHLTPETNMFQAQSTHRVSKNSGCDTTDGISVSEEWAL